MQQRTIAIGTVAIIMIAVAIVALQNVAQPEPTSPVPFETRAQAAAEAIREKNFEQLASLVHPTLGLTFHSWGIPNRSPTSSSDVFLPDDVRTFAQSTSFTIGDGPASGLPTTFIPATEIDRYAVGDVRYNPSENVEYSAAIEPGIMVRGIQQEFPGAMFAEYTFPGTVENSQMDWRRTFLIFQKHTDGEWYLVALTQLYWIP